MMTDLITTTFPMICAVLANSHLEEDIRWALDLANSQNGIEELEYAFDERMFHLNDLMLALCCGTVLPFTSPVGPEIEGNLARIMGSVQCAKGQSALEKVRSAYRKKLLINSKGKFEDVQYEIAVAAKACTLLDSGSVDLEAGIDGIDNDSDVRGTYHGVTVRLEVTVLHDSLPPAVDERLEDIVKAANVASGFIVSVRRLISSEVQANRVRALIELLFGQHAATSGADETIDGVRFEWKRGSYKCAQADSPILSIQFDLPNDVRLIERPVQTRSITPQYMIDDFEQPEGVTTLADAPQDPTTHQQNPLSSTIHKKIADKLKQCEDGVVNVVVLGKPLPMSDNSVDDALYGVLGVYVPFTEDQQGVRHSGQAIKKRDPRAPFVPAQNCPDPVQFVDPFRKVAAVWLPRLDGAYGLSKCLPNPNATRPIPRGLAEAITDEAPKCPPTAGDLGQPPSAPHEAPAEERGISDEEDASKEIVWAEMADEFIGVCGGVETAREVLAALERSGATLADFEKRVHEVFAPPADKEEGMKFVSPSNEEVGMHFVVGCGGFEHARACLDEWEIELDQRHQNP